MSKLIIQMFGDFSVRCGDISINDQSRRSKKMWKLLKYIITFREREIPQSELFELLWPGEERDNLCGALKTHLCRLRSVLAELSLPRETEIITSGMGSYSFNKSIDYTIDTAEFEKNFKFSLNPDISEKEQTKYLFKAVKLYKGDFLKKNSDEAWIIPISVYYHSLYIKAVRRLSDIFLKHKRFLDLVDLCRKALLIDNMDQQIHYYLIRALVELGDREGAKKHYHYVIDFFYDKQGVNPLPEIISLYDGIAKTDKAFETDINVIKEQLLEENFDKKAGAFFCELEFFKHVYQLEVRDAKRNKHPIIISLFTVVEKHGKPLEPKVLAKEMKCLRDAISQSLRISDIYARYNASQYIVMLPGASISSIEMIMKRIQRRFKQENPYSVAKIEYTYDDISEVNI